MRERISFKWGRDELCFALVSVPRVLLNHWASVMLPHQHALSPSHVAPMSPGEFAFVVYLSQYQVVWASEEMDTTLKTIATRMGISERLARGYRRSFEDGGYLKVSYSEGVTTYDFAGLSLALLEIDKAKAESPDATIRWGGTRVL